MMELASTFDIEDLIYRVDSFQQQQELHIIARLDEENCTLQRKVAHLRHRYAEARTLLREAKDMLKCLENAIREFQNRYLQAEMEWIRSWTI